MDEHSTDSGKQFDGQRSDERVLRVFRRNVLHFWLLTGLRFMSVIGLVVVWLRLRSGYVRLPMNWLIGGVIGLMVMRGLYKYILWYYTFYILTNQRLRCVERWGLFRQNTLDITISSIETVEYRTAGLGSELMRVGDLIIDSQAGQLTIEGAVQAKDLYNQLQDLIVNKF